MYIIIGILCILIGLVMLISPKTIFTITERWKNHNHYDEPSGLYIFSTRFGGVIFLLIGICSMIVQFIL